MKRISLALIALALAGCAPSAYVSRAPGQMARLADGQTVSISGRIRTRVEPGLFVTTTYRNLLISVDDQAVIDSPIQAVQLSGEFSGTWKGRAVSALCHRVTHGRQITVQCVVLIDNERTVTLSIT